MLEKWVKHTRTTLEEGDRALARRVIQQFVAKIVVKNGTGRSITHSRLMIV